MDHYRTLQVTRDAEPEVIERAYRALARKYHPDATGGDSGDVARMQAINSAYEVLRDPLRRTAYDRTLAPEPRASGWDVFMDGGLVGLFKERYGRRR